MDSKPVYNPDIGECYQYGTTLAYRSSTWAFNPTIPKEKFTDQIAKNPRKCMNEYGSVKPQAAEAFCRDSTLVDRRANPLRLSPIKEDGTFEDWFLPEGDTPYFFHGDLGATRDAAGFSLAHVDQERKKVVVDLMLKFVPPPGGSLQFERFKQLVLSIRKRGFYLEKVTFDSWNSIFMVQALQDRGLNVSVYSVDRTTAAYDTLLELLLMDQLDFYPNPVFSWEFSNLQFIGGKVDHKANGGEKDLSDAVSASVFHCVESGLMNMSNSSSASAPLITGEQPFQSFTERGGVLVPSDSNGVPTPTPRSVPIVVDEDEDTHQESVPAIFF